MVGYLGWMVGYLGCIDIDLGTHPDWLTATAAAYYPSTSQIQVSLTKVINLNLLSVEVIIL